jgi:hypothetical protein
MKSVSVVFLALLLFILPAGRAPWIDERPKAIVAGPERLRGKSTALRFEVRVAPGLVANPRDGRLLVVLSAKKQREPRLSIGQTGLDAPPVLGCDVNGLAPGVVAVIDQKATTFPIDHLADLAAGDYYAQAIFDCNRDLKLPNAPGNLYGPVQRITLDTAKGGTIALQLTQQVPPEELPRETSYVRYVKIQSKLLSRFHQRPIYLRAGIVLSRDFDREPGRRYPLRVHIGGYGTRFTNVDRMMSDSSEFRKNWLADDSPRMILLHLDGAGPYGDPYQVNSANNGPYGDAVTQELIPYVEQQFRGIGQPFARVLDGTSTGGWVSLALQVFYPAFFNGAWSQCPDPVDFRAYELINIYEDANAYVNQHGFERPAKRQPNGDTYYTVRHECQIENVLGRGGRWSLSGKDWCAWNATYGPCGSDGYPQPLWDPKTGQIDRAVVPHWKQYDLRLVLEQNWRAIGPKLQGKLHIWVGEADDYFLNNAVHLLEASLKKADPPYGGRIEFAPGQGHRAGWSERQVMQEMAVAINAAQR